MNQIAVERIYETDSHPAGKRILVDRLWPRGISKERAALDLWLKEIAPSTELRKWFHSGEGDYAQFKAKYLEEIAGNPGPFDELLAIVGQDPVVLLYGSHDVEHNHALILKDLLEQRQNDA